jgi:hypothetical protein
MVMPVLIAARTGFVHLKLKMEAAISSKMLIYTHKATQHNIENHNLNLCRCLLV